MIRKRVHTSWAKSHKILLYLESFHSRLQIKQVARKQYNSWKTKTFKISSDIMEGKICFRYIWTPSSVKPPPKTIRNHSQNWQKSCNPPLPSRCHKWMTTYFICNRTLQFSNFWLKISKLTKKRQIKWYCQGRCKTLLSRIVSFQLANFFKINIYMTFVINFRKKSTGRIVSLVVLIVCVPFPSLFYHGLYLYRNTIQSKAKWSYTIKISKLQEALRRRNFVREILSSSRATWGHFRRIVWEH